MTEPSAYAGYLLRDLRATLDDLVKFRNSREGVALMHDEFDVLKCLETLQWIVTDLAETRRNEARKLRVVR